MYQILAKATRAAVVVHAFPINFRPGFVPVFLADLDDSKQSCIVRLFFICTVRSAIIHKFGA